MSKDQIDRFLDDARLAEAARVAGVTKDEMLRRLCKSAGIRITSDK